MGALMIFTDAVRWWGAVAGFIGCHDIIQWLRWRHAGGQSQMHLTTWSHGWGVALISVYFLIAGLTIPLSDRIVGFGGRGGLLLAEILAVAWVIGSTSAWLVILDHGGRPRLMAWVAGAMFPAMLLASYLTVHA